jgi:hypothetical protein
LDDQEMDENYKAGAECRCNRWSGKKVVHTSWFQIGFPSLLYSLSLLPQWLEETGLSYSLRQRQSLYLEILSRHSQVATFKLSRQLATVKLSQSRCNSQVVTGTLSQSSCNSQVVTGTLSQSSCLSQVVKGMFSQSVVTFKLSQSVCHI